MLKTFWTRRQLLMATAAAGSLRAKSKSPELPSFWVFGLLQPRELRLTACPGTRLHCFGKNLGFVLEPGESRLISPDPSLLHAAGPGDLPAEFVLEVPQALRRRFYGSLAIRSADGILAASIRMPIEVAVGAIVGAELPVSQAPLESLRAQAIVARSFLLGTASPRDVYKRQ